ncbi:MAG: DUF938 domain-containing protein [Cyanobacteria bacterium P01_F01_bin.116]
MPNFKPNDGRLYAPATERNRDVILEVLEQVLPNSGTVLEIASGTGEHAAYFAPKLAPRRWLPSDISDPMLKSITAWARETNARYLLPAIELDVSHTPWPVEQDDKWSDERAINAIVNINMIHIAPWKVCEALMDGAGRILPNGGVLYLYGPFKRNGKHTAPSNETFDSWLKEQNTDWGVRDLEAVEETAKEHQLELKDVVEMPANNFSLVFYKKS